jgi:hypothetical protein
VNEATFDVGHLPVWLCVIPVRMREAWLLFDEDAIRKAAGNPSGTVALHLPALGQCENLPDPKRVLQDLLRDASGLRTRRRARLRISPMVRRVSEYVHDFAPLRTMPAFSALERAIQEAVRRNRWDHR